MVTRSGSPAFNSLSRVSIFILIGLLAPQCLLAEEGLPQANGGVVINPGEGGPTLGDEQGGGSSCNPNNICNSHCDPMFNSEGDPIVDGTTGALICNPATYVCEVTPECAGLGYGCVCVFYPDPPQGSSASSSSQESSSSPSSDSSSAWSESSSSLSQESSSSSSSLSTSSALSSDLSESSASSSSSSSSSSESDSAASSEVSASSSSADSSQAESSSSSVASSAASEGSSAGSSDSSLGGCIAESIEAAQAALQLGPQQLKDYAMVTHLRLERNAARTNKALGIRLGLSAKKAGKKMSKHIADATVALAQLPKVLLLCPVDEPGCQTIDHAALIEQHRKAVIRLRQLVIRMLNRATRLVYNDTRRARKMTKKTAKGARAIAKDLVAVADGLPKTRSECPGIDL